MSPTALVQAFENHTLDRIANTFQEKTYFTEELRPIRRQRQRIYRISGRSTKYLELKDKYNKRLKAKQDSQKILSEVSKGKRNNSYTALRKLKSGENISKKSSCTLPFSSSSFESAERLADYFS